jgi:hypothetical protein
MTESGTASERCVAKVPVTLNASAALRECGEPCEYLTQDQAHAEMHFWSGWYHVDRSLTLDHHAVPESMIR